jgi:hypothetical protein
MRDRMCSESHPAGLKVLLKPYLTRLAGRFSVHEVEHLAPVAPGHVITFAE